MNLSNIRIQYSGLISFISGLVGLAFGLFFTLTITRRLSPEEYGVWGLLLSIVNYFLISEVIFSYWSTRETARGIDIGKSAIFSSSLLSILVIPIFVTYVFFVSESSNAPFETLLLGILLIPVSFISQTLAGINLGHKPHVVSYSQIVFQTIKIPIALLSIVVFDFSVFGVVLAVLIAFIGKILVQYHFAKNYLVTKFSIQKFKWWIKHSWIPLITTIQNYLGTIDIALFSIITGSVIGIAYYSASFAIAAIVQHSGSISLAIYSKLLSGKNFEGIAKNFNYILYFLVLLAGISILFSKPSLFALNPLYQNAWPVVIILTIKISSQALRTIPVFLLLGTEQIDADKNLTFSKLLKSNLFTLPKFLIIFNFLYILILIVFLMFSKNSSFSELDLVTWWAIIGLFAEIPLSILLWIRSRKIFKICFPIKNFIKYLIGISSFIIVFFATSESILKYNIRIYDFLPSLLFELFLCTSVYFVVTYLIDHEVRNLFKTIIKELRNFLPL